MMISARGPRSTSTLPRAPTRIRSMEAEDARMAEAVVAGRTLYEVFMALKERER
jgi:hypothetical protein